jgi:hypothetical protein
LRVETKLRASQITRCGVDAIFGNFLLSINHGAIIRDTTPPQSASTRMAISAAFILSLQ